MMNNLSGEDRKRLGQAAVLKPAYEWKDHAMHELRLFCLDRKKQGGPEFAFEEFRRWCLERGVIQPRSHKAWGALASVAAREGVIEDTGDYRKAVSRRTHAHPVKVWRVV